MNRGRIVRLSAIDWPPEGQTIEDSIVVARALKERGCAIIDVSSGHSSADEDPDYDRCYQVPFSERIRHEAQIRFTRRCETMPRMVSPSR